MTIPIHAYPTLHKTKLSQFPSKIDIGRNCKVGNFYQKSLFIESNSPVCFEYEVTVVKAHPEITIETPLTGELLGNQIFEFKFSYNPLTQNTAESEIIIKTSEFDSQSHRILLIANAAPQYNQSEVSQY